MNKVFTGPLNSFEALAALRYKFVLPGGKFFIMKQLIWPIPYCHSTSLAFFFQLVTDTIDAPGIKIYDTCFYI
jgi:hypothetical protein